MTNLLVAIVVSVVTNVTVTTDEIRSPFRDSWLVSEPQPGSIIKPATMKTETTEIVEIKRLTFTWEGEEYSTERKKVLSRVVKKWKKREDWVDE